MIATKIKLAARQLLDRLERPGEKADRTVLEELGAVPGASFPRWLIELLVEYPLSGVQIGVEVADGAAETGRERLLFEIGDAALIKELNLDTYPGMYLYPRGYIALGCGVQWAGDVLVLSADSDDPPLYQVWHDVSHDPIELEAAIRSGARGTRQIASSLSGLMAEGLAVPPMDFP